MKIIESQAKTIFTKTKLPGADWVINQYVGCSHNCSYCYAKFIGKWKNHGKWGNWVEAKINAPELVKGNDFMSSVSDAYQPIEEKLKLTRMILENMDKRIKLSILTKSDLILRDIDILKQFKDIEIGFTINGFDKFELNATSNEERIKALKVLKEKGFRTYTFISPIIPELTDLKSVIERTKEYSDYYWFEFINLKGAGKEFSDTLKKNYPLSYDIIRDGKRFDKFYKECKDIIKREEVKTRGIEIHG